MTEELEPQSKAFKWDTFYYGPEGYDEHVGVTKDSAAEMTAARETIIKGLADIKAKPKGGPNGPRAYTPAAAATGGSAQTAAPAATGNGVAKVCPAHGAAMRPNVKQDATGNPTVPGVTTLMSKAGRPYTAFWVCTADQNCKER